MIVTEYQWVNGQYQQVEVPGYFETVTKPGYYEQVWHPLGYEIQWVCHWVDRPPQDDYWGFGFDEYKNAAVGDRTIKEVVWFENQFKTSQSVGMLPPANEDYGIQGINLFCYIKCRLYDNHYNPLK